MAFRTALALTLPALVSLVVACGGDDPETSPDPSTTSTSTATTSTTSTTSTSSAGGGGAGGEGGAGGAGGGATGTGGAGGGATACVLYPPDTFPPTEYTSDAFKANAAVELDLRSKLGAFQDPMKAAEADVSVKPTLDELEALYAAGTPSLKSVTTSYYAGKVQGWLETFVAAAGHTWTPSDPPEGPGGIFGTHIYSAEGTDLRQAVEKGLFNAAFYNHALALSQGTVDAATLDRILAAFGAHPSFPGDSAAGDTNPNPDALMAAYAERRSPKDASDASKPADPANPGPYFRMKASLIEAQAALAAGEACAAELDAALEAFLLDWEKANFGTAIYYLHSAAQKLTKESPTTADLDSGLHGYGEAVAFVHGFRQLPADGRKITDAEIDGILEKLGAPAEGPVTSYKLVTDAASEVTKLQQAIAAIVAVYGFTTEEVETFKTNH